MVVWHWQHFFAIDGSWPDHWDRTSQPLFRLLKPLYLDGWLAVDLFFALSGFVFFWLYGEAIRTRRQPGFGFAVLRFSRLYPLHFATLAFVAILQIVFTRETGRLFIYGDNDAFHFLTNLAFAQQWAPPTNIFTFNGPAWSVSIEVLLYILFFFFCRMGLGKAWQLAAAVSLGLVLFYSQLAIARGLIGFFMGGLAYSAWERLRARSDARRWAILAGALALGAWAVCGLETYTGLFDQPVDRFASRYFGADPLHDYAFNILFVAFIVIVSPLTVLALALSEDVLGVSYRRLSFLGDISYSTYMLHYPMQLTLATIAARAGMKTQAFLSPWSMLAFYAALIALGTLSYRYFERPMQKLIRVEAHAGPASRATEP